jgi:hypothetical protein
MIVSPLHKSIFILRHGLARPGHPRLWLEDVDARHKAGHDGAIAIDGYSSKFYTSPLPTLPKFLARATRWA